MSTREASIATRRFGLGPKPGDLQRIGNDPRGYVLAALERKDAAVITSPDLEPSHVSWRTLREAAMAERAARERGQQATDDHSGKMQQTAPGGTEWTMAQATANASAETTQPGLIRRGVESEEAAARLERAVTTDQPILERLVMFWSNHFCVSAAKGPMVGVLAGAYEREAIRPHVLGRFADMLKAVEQHPAMLVYLDNSQSSGPNSQVGRNRGRGLNENLAREILELHTLGVDGGYQQADVINLARLITGWTVGGINQQRVEPGRFFFAAARHEPGTFPVLGKRYEGNGVAVGEAALDDLARHPATARHIARKLATHFLGDGPPEGLVARLEASLLNSDGDLSEVSKSLVMAPECWREMPRKVAPPYDFLVSLKRGLAFNASPGEVLKMAGALGQPLWRPPSPKGWPDGDGAWMGSSALRERLRITHRLARAIGNTSDPRAVAEDLIGDQLSDRTREAIARAETREQGFELLVMSPEIQRR
jgi:uncharacterized protein (DUF1800 family)